MSNNAAIVLLAGLAALELLSCAAPPPSPTKPPVPSAPHVLATQTGIASFYSGHRTASGERPNPRALTAAHPSWPFGARVRVTNLNTGRWAIVRINDRGPFTRGRVIDLTPAAAEAIGLTRKHGITRVKIERLQ